MKSREVFTDALVIYLKRIWLYLPFSLLIICPMFLNFWIFSSEASAILLFILTFALSFVSVLSAALLISSALERHMKLSRKYIAVVLLRSIILVFISFGYRFFLYKGIDKMVIQICTLLTFWLIGGVVVLSLCHAAEDAKNSFLSVIRSNKAFLLKCFLYVTMIFIIFAFVALGAAQPSKFAVLAMDPDAIKEKEIVSFCILSSLFAPLYILNFVVAYKNMPTK